MQLSLAEWKSLCVGNMGMVSSELNKLPGIRLADVDELNKWWGETMLPRLKAWATECAIVEKEMAKVQAPVPPFMEPAEVAVDGEPIPPSRLPPPSNGVPPVRKGKGWPAGKKRGPRKPVPVAPPAVTM